MLLVQLHTILRQLGLFLTAYRYAILAWRTFLKAELKHKISVF